MQKLQQPAGAYIVFGYCVLFYLIPAFGQYLFFNDIFSIYQRSQDSLNAIIFILLSLSIFITLYLTIRHKKIIIFSRLWGLLSHKCILFYIRNRLLLLIFFYIIIGYIFITGHEFNNIRYTSTSISQAGGFAYIYLIIKTIVTFDLLLIFFLIPMKKSSHLHVKRVVTNSLSLILYFLLNGGNADIPLGLVILGFLIFRNLSMWFIFLKENDRFRVLTSIFRNFILLIMIFPVLILILYLGESVKTNYSIFEIDIISFFERYNGIQSFLYYLIESFSSALHSLNFSLERGGNYPLENLFVLIYDSTSYRISSIMSGFGVNFGIEKPDIGGLSQFNFIILTDILDSRQGTSPGIFASFIYLLGIPLGLLFSAFYLVFIARIIDWLLMLRIENKRYSLIGYSVVLYLTAVFFQSPIDLLNVLDNGSILAILIILLASLSKYITMQKNRGRLIEIRL